MSCVHKVAYALLLLQCVVMPSVQGETPVRIGVSLGLTGSYGNMSQIQSHAYKLWEKHINARGGILGRKVEMVIRDDNSNVETAKKIYQNFVQTDKVDFVLGPYSGPITEAVVPIIEQYGYPMLASSATSDELWKHGYTHLSTIISPASRYTIGFLTILGQTKLKQMAVVYADDKFSTGLAEGTKKWAAEYGIQITSYQKIAKGSVDLTGPAKIAHDSGAQALVMAGHYEESVNMRKALKQIGWMPNAYYASVGPGTNNYQTALGNDAEATFSSSDWEAHEGLKLPGSKEFLREYIKDYGEKPSYHGARAYAAAQVLEQAIKKAGNFDRKTVRDALFQLDTQSLIGRYVVDRTGAQMKGFPMITQWQKGKREIVWPDELRTAEPIFNK